MVTGGEKGSSCYFRDVGTLSRPAFPVIAVDTTGAGDSFTAGFLYAMSRPGASFSSVDDVGRALAIAAAAGGLVCTKAGAIYGQPSLEEVLQVVDDNKPAHCSLDPVLT